MRSACAAPAAQQVGIVRTHSTASAGESAGVFQIDGIVCASRHWRDCQQQRTGRQVPY